MEMELRAGQGDEQAAMPLQNAFPCCRSRRHGDADVRPAERIT